MSRSGAKLRPWRPSGDSMPHSSTSVGNRSTSSTSRGETPAFRPGAATISGTRADSSYRLIFPRNPPCSPRCLPWSAATTTTVFSARPRRSTASRMTPTCGVDVGDRPVVDPDALALLVGGQLRADEVRLGAGDFRDVAGVVGRFVGQCDPARGYIFAYPAGEGDAGVRLVEPHGQEERLPLPLLQNLGRAQARSGPRTRSPPWPAGPRVWGWAPPGPTWCWPATDRTRGRPCRAPRCSSRAAGSGSGARRRPSTRPGAATTEEGTARGVAQRVLAVGAVEPHAPGGELVDVGGLRRAAVARRGGCSCRRPRSARR